MAARDLRAESLKRLDDARRLLITRLERALSEGAVSEKEWWTALEVLSGRARPRVVAPEEVTREGELTRAMKALRLTRKSPLSLVAYPNEEEAVMAKDPSGRCPRVTRTVESRAMMALRRSVRLCERKKANDAHEMAKSWRTRLRPR